MVVMVVKSPVTVSVTDPYCQDLDESLSPNYSFRLKYSESSSVDDGEILSHGTDINIGYPVTDSTELDHLRHLNAQAAEISTKTVKFGKSNRLESSVRFDNAILDVSDRALSVENRSVGSFDIPERHIKAIILHDARKMNSRPSLEKHLNKYQGIAARIGYDNNGPVSQSRYAQIESELEHERDRGVLRKAAKRAVHAVWRNGLPIPETVRCEYDLPKQAIINESNISPSTRREALRNWIRKLLPRLLEPVSFNRGSNSSYTVEQIIGSIAQAALIDGLFASKSIAGWHYCDDELIAPRQLNNLAGGFTRKEILQTFSKVNRNFISIAEEHGFFSTEYNYALDNTWVSWGGDENAIHLIENPDRCDTGRGWCFAAVTIMDPNARFALGIDLVSDKSETVHQYHHLLRIIARDHPIGGIYMDREFTSRAAVNMCRDLTDSWAIRAKLLKGPIKNFYDNAEIDEPKGPDEINFADLTPKPQLYCHPLSEDHREATNDTHMAFLTSRYITDEEAESIYSIYSHRWSIETYFRQLKHRFTPNTKSPNENIRLFLFNIGSVIYNIHTLIKRCPSPQYGLRIDAQYYEVLQAIIDVVFTSGVDE